MAEVAAGAVKALLGILQSEAQQLRRVGHDVQFIKEEMESMRSFLEHLAKTTPPGGSHDEQVQTWMRQVRLLAQDCSTCIDRYLVRSDPAILGAGSTRFRRSLCWLCWSIEGLLAKREAGAQLRELKERASDVGKRRLRYGVEIPGKASAAPTALLPSSTSSGAAARPASLPFAGVDDEDVDGTSEGSEQQAPVQFPTLDDYFLEKVVHRVLEAAKASSSMQSIAIVVAPDGGSVIAREALKRASSLQFQHTVCIELSSVHYRYDKLGTNRILCYVLLHACKLVENKKDDKITKYRAWKHKRETKRKIMEQVEDNVSSKIQELESKIQGMEAKIEERRGGSNKAFERFELNFGSKIQELESKVKDVESKIKDVEAKIDKKTIEGSDRNTHEDVEVKDKETTTEGIRDKSTDELTKGSVVVALNDKPSSSDVKPKTDQKTTGESKVVAPQTDKPLGVLYLALLQSEHESEKAKDVLESDEEALIEATAVKLREHIGSGADQEHPPINPHVQQYAGILRELFSAQEADAATTAAAATAGHDHIKEISDDIKETVGIVKQDVLEQMKDHVEETIRKVKQEILQEVGDQMKKTASMVKQHVQEMQSHGTPGEPKLSIHRVAKAVQDAKEKIPQIKLKIKQQMVIKGIVDKIDDYLKGDSTLIILEDENRRRGSKWEDVMAALRLLKCAKGSAVVVTTTTKDIKKAKEFCYPPVTEPPITYSLAWMYHDIVLQTTKQQMDDEDSRIIRDIMERCDPHESCMQMFARAVCANPNRSTSKELGSLLEDLSVSASSESSRSTFATTAKKIFKFSYKHLPREHKSCLLYLAVFHPGDNLRRSRLIGRWITEGLITEEDWTTAVSLAKQCFQALIVRGLVLPGDISAKGDFKSCKVGDPVHGFIIKMAKKKHFLDARLSQRLAQHFSVFSGVRLRASDTIDKFVQNLRDYAPQLSLLRLLDLQDCQCFHPESSHLKVINNICFEQESSHLKVICNNIPLLKYLSLRGTDVTHLPRDINNLHDLEILDIRQTKVPERETYHVLLLKLRRLLAGGNDPSLSGTKSCVWIPHKIEKMEQMEVLSNVKPSPFHGGKELKDVRKLWQLRKLGVVIKDNDRHILNLLRAVRDLNESLRSLSVTIDGNTEAVSSINDRIQSLSSTIYKTAKEVTSWDIKEKLSEAQENLEHLSKLLESVSIKGHTKTVPLLSLLAKNSKKLAKVVLSGTMILEKEDLKVLAKLPKLRCVGLHLQLQHDKYNKESNLPFKKVPFEKEEFDHLQCLLVSGDYITDITFEKGAAVELEKIVLSSTNVKSLPGVGLLPNLKELELKGNKLFASFSGDGATQKSTKVEAAPQRSTEVVVAPRRSSETGVTPQKSSEIISASEAGAAPQKSTEAGAALQKNSEAGTAPQASTEPISPIQDRIVAPHGETERKITFKEGEFQHLKYFFLEDLGMLNILFEKKAAPELENLILSLASKESQLTVNGASLPKLKDVKLKGDRSIFLPLIENSDSRISKVSLSDTLLNKADLELLANKPYICSLELLDNSCAETQLTFKKDQFPKLKLLIVNCSKIDSISFDEGSAPQLEKVVWSFTKLQSLSGIHNVLKLKELKLEGDPVPDSVRKDIESHRNRLDFSLEKPQDQDQGNKKQKGSGQSWLRRMCLRQPFTKEGGSASTLVADQGN